MPPGEQFGACADCHRKNSPALVMEWERSVRFQRSVGCLDCRASGKGKPGAWLHGGSYVSVLVTPKDSWVLGKDYSAAPTCASCHISSYLAPEGVVKGNSHDVGERITWTLRPVVSVKLNQVTFEDGNKEDYPETKSLPKVGDELATADQVVENDRMVTKPVKRKVAKITTWQQRRDVMKGACLNCHNNTCVDNFYKQFDDLVVLYNDKFARPAQQLMNELTKDGALDPKAPFEHEVQWVFRELWHHEGRRARHGAGMMGPDYTHWHGTCEVSKHFYSTFLPAAVEAAAQESPGLKKKYQEQVEQLLARDEHRWIKGLAPQEAEALKKSYRERYNQ
jgi:cytochrome c553